MNTYVLRSLRTWSRQAGTGVPSSSRMCIRTIWRSHGRRLCPWWWDRQVENNRWSQRPRSVSLRCETISCRWESSPGKVSILCWVHTGAQWRRMAGLVPPPPPPLYLERNSLRVEAHVLQRPTRLGCASAGTAVTDDNMGVVDDREPQASSSSEPVPDVTTRPVLKRGQPSRSCTPRCENWSSRFTDDRRALPETVWIRTGCSQEEKGGISGEQEGGVGIGDRTGNAKGPSWSGSTITSRTRSPHGESLAACSVARAVCDGSWEGWPTSAERFAWEGRTTPCDSLRLWFCEDDIRWWRGRTEICLDIGCCGRRFVLRECHHTLGKGGYWVLCHWADQIHHRFLSQTCATEMWRRALHGGSRQQSETHGWRSGETGDNTDTQFCFQPCWAGHPNCGRASSNNSCRLPDVLWEWWSFWCRQTDLGMFAAAGG